MDCCLSVRGLVGKLDGCARVQLDKHIFCIAFHAVSKHMDLALSKDNISVFAISPGKARGYGTLCTQPVGTVPSVLRLGDPVATVAVATNASPSSCTLW